LWNKTFFALSDKARHLRKPILVLAMQDQTPETMRRAVTVCRKIEDTLANSFLFVGFALVNLPFPQAANHFRITGANISFTFGIATHDAKFKILKRKN